MMDAQEVRAHVFRALEAEGHLVEEGGRLDESTRINAGEFRIDSLAFIRAFISLEDDLGVEFGDESLMQNTFVSVGDVVRYVHRELQEQALS